jgi:hypothetical protein
VHLSQAGGSSVQSGDRYNQVADSEVQLGDRHYSTLRWPVVQLSQMARSTFQSGSRSYCSDKWQAVYFCQVSSSTVRLLAVLLSQVICSIVESGARPR